MNDQLELDIDGEDRLPSVQQLLAINAKLVALLERRYDSPDLFSGRLWSFDDIAYYLGVSRSTVRRIFQHPNAPPALRLSSGGRGRDSHMTNRYHVDAVMRFIVSIDANSTT